jgi:hypothetical protein
MLTVKGSQSKINKIYSIHCEPSDYVEFTKNIDPQLFIRAAAVL